MVIHLTFSDCKQKNCGGGVLKSRYLSDSEIFALQSTLSDAAWLPFRISAETGLRVGDVIKIRLSDLRNDGFFFVAQKTKKEGFAKVHSGTISALKRNAGFSEWCFPSPKKAGEHITRQAVWRRLKTACGRAGVDVSGVSPHSFRKVFSVELYKKSDLRTVQKALQHSSVYTTEIYTLADWSTGENAELPILRGDITMIAQKVAEIVLDRLTKDK